MTTDLPAIPASFNDNPSVLDTVKLLIDRIQNNTNYSSDCFSWDQARVRSLERYELTFTDEEKQFFHQLLEILAAKI
jgi:hypothetical protein